MVTAKSAPEFWRHPGLPMVEGRRANGSTACYRPHSHETLSLGIVDAGESTLRLTLRRIALHPGDVVLIRPHEVHSCNPRLATRWSYRMFYFDVSWVAELLRDAGLPSSVMNFSGRLRAPRVGLLVNRLTVLLRQPARGAAGAQAVGEILAEIYRSLPSAGNSPEETRRAAVTPPVLESVRAFIEARAADRLPVRALAASAGMSAYRLIRAFKRGYGLTPHAYQLDCRIRCARELIKCGTPPVEVAGELGFSDQSHFQRAFKARVAATPGQYSTAPRAISCNTSAAER